MYLGLDTENLQAAIAVKEVTEVGNGEAD